ncbi:polysaccharide biosynthesis tyrosine autokinase [Rheinheimera sp. MMS21-TC3]|uniref:polysaccharide biosynthesis tyrosine autokinase n=1 Tax=Rheinheimera sp. MMS21-TC3 TaxID=3072790 RepID=UPI0028C45472|nr:polysaccharide biosynthesis tyrosine autokinase [Rheinheimera sp. MMS21-TC3]WNO61705.1 polysaccharide biosynthesis tyrosine autokinase [Rheinheimera sp. MMS21-TC3]
MQQASNSQNSMQNTSNEIDLARLFGQLLDHKWLIIAITAIFCVVGVSYALLATPIYRADALLQVEKKSTGMPMLGEMGEMFAGESEAATEIEIIKSRMIIGSVVDQLDLTTIATPNYMPVIGGFLARRSPEQDQLIIKQFTVPKKYIGQKLNLAFKDNSFRLSDANYDTVLAGEVGQLATDDDWALHISAANLANTQSYSLTKINRLKAINDWQQLLNVSERGKQTGILTASIQHDNKQLAKNVLNAIAEEYMLQNIQRNAAEAEKSLVFLNQQIPDIKRNLTKAEEQLNKYRLQSKSVDLSLETSGILSQVIEVERQLNELQIKETELSRLYTKQHPSYQSLISQKQTLMAEQAKLTSQIEDLPETQQQVLRLTRDVEVNQEIYLQLVNRMQELNILKAGTVGNVRILDHAETNILPVAPKKSLIVVMATILGGMLAVALVLVRAALNRGIQSADELEDVGINVYASVPLSEQQQAFNKKHRLIGKKNKLAANKALLLAKADPTDLAIEALRGLRTSLHFAMLEARNNIIMVSGPSPAVGKSFISANLAAVLAAGGQRVLYIDGDIRRGYSHLMLHVKNDFGLSDFVADNTKSIEHYKKVVQVTNIPGLDFISRGTAAPNPAELLMHNRMKQLLEQAAKDYDYVLIDTPPILAVTDAAIIGHYAGTSLLVARFDQTPVNEMQHTVQRFEKNGITIKGVILNGVERRASGYQYQYQYGYAYKSDNQS